MLSNGLSITWKIARVRCNGCVMDRQSFERLVERAITGLPEEFRDQLENLDVVVEDRPMLSQLNDMRMTLNDTRMTSYHFNISWYHIYIISNHLVLILEINKKTVTMTTYDVELHAYASMCMNCYKI